MILKNLEILPSGKLVDIHLQGKKIIAVQDVSERGITDQHQIHFTNAICFPGLINSHDHLDFNFFPMLGLPPYQNYTEWGPSIQKEYARDIEQILSIPLALRFQWGIYKNLLCGVTSVAHHGRVVRNKNTAVHVLTGMQNLHSLKFEKFWWLKMNNPAKMNVPCVIHIGEGIDTYSKKEIDILITNNFMKRPLVAVHGISMTQEQASSFRGLIWCPVSNNFLFNASANINKLASKTLVCLGTDSTLTSTWNIWQHLRMAKEKTNLNKEELFDIVIKNPAKLWNIGSSQTSGQLSDLVVASKPAGIDALEGFCSLNPEKILMVIKDGIIRVLDASLLGQMSNEEFAAVDYTEIVINGTHKFVEGDLTSLVSSVKKYNSSAEFPFHFPGSSVGRYNPNA